MIKTQDQIVMLAMMIDKEVSAIVKKMSGVGLDHVQLWFGDEGTAHFTIDQKMQDGNTAFHHFDMKDSAISGYQFQILNDYGEEVC